MKLKDPGSAITHLIGMICAAVAFVPLMMKASRAHSPLTSIIALIIFMTSMILLYAASTTYHSLYISKKISDLLKKIDHSMIFILIAGSYTPICIIALHNTLGYVMLALIWTLAIVGIVIKCCFIFLPKWLSSVIYIAMGWVCIIALVPLFKNLSHYAFALLVAGGVIYTIGGVLYALKLSIFNNRHPHFGSHEVFHLFVMGGSLCHYLVMYSLA